VGQQDEGLHPAVRRLEQRHAHTVAPGEPGHDGHPEPVVLGQRGRCAVRGVREHRVEPLPDVGLDAEAAVLDLHRGTAPDDARADLDRALGR
jgi:hypothetical protein